MTAEEFKKAKPELSHLEGIDLVNAMEDYFLRLQDGYMATKIVLPFWKRYTFRWLFYRKRKNWILINGYRSSKRCAVCKKSTGMLWGLGGELFCPRGHKYKEEPNISMSHLLYVIWVKICMAFWSVLDWLHIVRSAYDTRYGLMGDEAGYVDHWQMNYDTGETRHVLKKRKWWQYIFVERKFRPNFK